MDKRMVNQRHQTHSNDLNNTFRNKFHYWFVQYNPFYFFSALSVLFGVYLVSLGLKDIGWNEGQLALTGIMQVYEILFIIGAAFLFRVARQSRPAVMLALMEVFFLFDCTLRNETIVSFGRIGQISSVIWILLVPVKLLLLALIFRLRKVLATITGATIAAAGMAVTPHLFEMLISS